MKRGSFVITKSVASSTVAIANTGKLAEVIQGQRHGHCEHDLTGTGVPTCACALGRAGHHTHRWAGHHTGGRADYHARSGRAGVSGTGASQCQRTCVAGLTDDTLVAGLTSVAVLTAVVLLRGTM